MLEHVNEILGRYANRQAVINTYEEDEMVERDGLHFDSMRFKGDRLEIYRNGGVVKTVAVRPEASFVTLSGFKDHYAFLDGDLRIEVYFTH